MSFSDQDADELTPVDLGIMTGRRSMIKALHLAMDHPVRLVPEIPPEGEVRLRARLLVEETLEFVQACFSDSALARSALPRIEKELMAIIDVAQVGVDLPEVADALADIKVVAEGGDLAFGINGDRVFDLVHRSNMAKVGGGKREDGKFQKPPGWKPPNVAGVLREQGWKG